MNEEQIKEMCNDIYTGGDWKPMIDYITNLQKENDILNDITESYEETSKEDQEEMEKLQQRIDKAIEYIKKEDKLYYIKVFCRDLLKILGDDE